MNQTITTLVLSDV